MSGPDVSGPDGGGPDGGGSEPDQSATPDAGEPAEAQAAGSGPDLAREALERARKDARAGGSGPSPRGTGRGRASGGGRGSDRRSRGPVPAGGFSGPGPDERDPQPIGSSVERLVDQRRWRDPLSIGSVIAAWPQVAGAEVAAHCIPERVEDGVLVVRADSTAWATQLRLLASTLVARLNEELGGGAAGGQGSGGRGSSGAAGGAITSVTVLGPSAPSWKKGPRSVPGRGPRDTYG